MVTLKFMWPLFHLDDWNSGVSSWHWSGFYQVVSSCKNLMRALFIPSGACASAFASSLRFSWSTIPTECVFTSSFSIMTHFHLANYIMGYYVFYCREPKTNSLFIIIAARNNLNLFQILWSTQCVCVCVWRYTQVYMYIKVVWCRCLFH